MIILYINKFNFYFWVRNVNVLFDMMSKYLIVRQYVNKRTEMARDRYRNGIYEIDQNFRKMMENTRVKTV